MLAPKKLRFAISKRVASWLAVNFLPVVVFIVLGAIALRHPTTFWASLALTAVVLLLLATIVTASYGSASRRPFRAGFAIVGGSYFLLFLLFPNSNCMEELATSRVIDWSYSRLFPESPTNPVPSMRYSRLGGVFAVPPEEGDSDYVNKQTTIATSSQDLVDEAGNFWTIGHLLWTLIGGWIGGRSAQFLAWRSAKGS